MHPSTPIKGYPGSLVPSFLALRFKKLKYLSRWYIFISAFSLHGKVCCLWLSRFHFLLFDFVSMILKTIDISYGTIEYSREQCYTTQLNLLHRSTVSYSIAHHDTAHHITSQHTTSRHSTAQHSSTQLHDDRYN